MNHWPQNTIWDCVQDKRFKHHVIFNDAIGKVLKKIESGNLPDAYDIVDKPATRHRDVLLALPGKITIASFLQDGKLEYARSDSTGIVFNRKLVDASSIFYLECRCRGIRDPLKNFDALSFSVIFQETLQHELFHLKNHCELMNDPEFKTTTPKNPPRYGESGFAGEKRIRELLLGDENARFVYPLPKDTLERWKPPLNLAFGSVVITNDVIVPVAPDSPSAITMQELENHMRVSSTAAGHARLPQPEIRPPLSGGEADGSAGDESGASKQNRDHERVDGDKKPPASYGRGRSSPTWQRQEGALVVDPNLASNKPFKKYGNDSVSLVKSNSSDYDADGEKELFEFACQLGSAEFREIMSKASWENTIVQVQFCDKRKKKRSSFTSSEDIYVELTFTNPMSNKEDAYVGTYRGSFGRQGIGMSIVGQTERYLPTGALRWMVMAKLAPGESVTFFRKLCGGPNGRTTNTLGNTRGPACNLVPFWTPDVPGTYVAKVIHGSFSWDGSFSFLIQGGK